MQGKTENNGGILTFCISYLALTAAQIGTSPGIGRAVVRSSAWRYDCLRALEESRESNSGKQRTVFDMRHGDQQFRLPGICQASLQCSSRSCKEPSPRRWTQSLPGHRHVSPLCSRLPPAAAVQAAGDSSKTPMPESVSKRELKLYLRLTVSPESGLTVAIRSCLPAAIPARLPFRQG